VGPLGKDSRRSERVKKIFGTEEVEKEDRTPIIPSPKAPDKGSSVGVVCRAKNSHKVRIVFPSRRSKEQFKTNIHLSKWLVRCAGAWGGGGEKQGDLGEKKKEGRLGGRRA